MVNDMPEAQGDESKRRFGQPFNIHPPTFREVSLKCKTANVKRASDGRSSHNRENTEFANELGREEGENKSGLGTAIEVVSSKSGYPRLRKVEDGGQGISEDDGGRGVGAADDRGDELGAGI